MTDIQTGLDIPTPRVFAPLLKPSRYKAAHGGRGSGKSHFFAELLVEHHVLYPGLRSVCIREVQNSLKDSAKKIVEDKIRKHGLESKGFRIMNDKIITPGDGVIIFNGMKDHTADSIKSLEGFGIAWCEEAQSLSKRSITMLRPTIRDSGIPEFSAEIWFSWNPTRKTDEVDVLFRGEAWALNDSIIVKANYNNNPWFPDVLESERLDDQEKRPDSYDNVWEGGYVTAADGAYWVKHINKAKKEGRIGFIPRDPLMHTYAFWDIGGTGAKADACSIWLVQFVGKEIRVIDHYEAQGQELKDHVYWLNQNEYGGDSTTMYLPHDGVKHDAVNRVTYESALINAGFKVVIMPNAGTGAAMQRVRAVQMIFHRIFIDKVKCEAGIESLGWYHEKKNKESGMGMGPNHDWSSHSADSFGAMCLEAEKLSKARAKSLSKRKNKSTGGWMSG
jgi:phage terminase large subunit